VRGLEHLAGVERVEIGVVVAQPLRDVPENLLCVGVDALDPGGGQRAEAVLEPLQRVAQRAQRRLVQQLGSPVRHGA
jgi:hypothetical protein